MNIDNTRNTNQEIGSSSWCNEIYNSNYIEWFGEEGYNIKTDIAKGDAKYAIYSLTNNPCNIDDEDLEEADVNKMYEEHMSYDYETQYDKVPETIDMFDNPNVKNVNEKLSDSQLIANEVNLIKEHGFMDYLKGTIYSKKGGKDGSKR